MNSFDPFNQPQGSTPPAGPPYPGEPSVQPQSVQGEPLYAAAPGSAPAMQRSAPVAQQMHASQQVPAPANAAGAGQAEASTQPAQLAQQPQPVQPGQSMQPNAAAMYLAPPKPPKTWMIVAIILMVTTLGFGAGFVWSTLQYIDHRDNVDSKVTTAVAEAVKEQADKDAATFLEKEKEPNRSFVGPDDYGRLSFNYPKTWSVYVDKDALRGGAYAAYLNPVTVPPVGIASQQFALRVLIEEKDYDRVVDSYKTKVERGELKSSAVKADDQNGTRLDGMFTKDIQGSAVIFKIRDKTVTMQTDANVFDKDFNALIKTITFNR